MTDNNLLTFAKNIINIEISALAALQKKLDNKFIQAVNIIKNCSGKVIVTGMGKSGHIGRKIAATFASTGTPSFFLHPAEAAHGDLGMIDKSDVVICISYSGSTQEIVSIWSLIRRLKVKTISITGSGRAVLAKECDVFLDCSVAKEACPHNLAPTSSTTTALVLGDALAMTLLQERGFSANDFARSHPSGALGKKLLTNVKDIMHKDLPLVKPQDILIKSLVIMSSKKIGMLIAVNTDNSLYGIFTDGDLRRTIENNKSIEGLTIKETAIKNAKSINMNCAAVKALAIMEKFSINGLPVIDDNDKVVGAINMQTLIQNKLV